MTAPNDRLANVKFQDLNNVLNEMEHSARRTNQKVFYGYPYCNEPNTSQTIQFDQTRYVSTTMLKQRQLRLIGALLDVPWTTDYATTKAAIVTAAGLL